MILNLRVDHKIADIQSMENISKQIDDLFDELQEKYSINEYVEISTCNRKEYYIHNDYISPDDDLLSHENQSITYRIRGFLYCNCPASFLLAYLDRSQIFCCGVSLLYSPNHCAHRIAHIHMHQI